MIADCARPLANLVRGRPVLATFQVTLRCNSACGYCDLPLNQGRYELTREEIRGIFGQLYTEGIRFVLVQGGEPLLRTDLVDILADLSSLGLQVTVITNGTRLTTDLVAHGLLRCAYRYRSVWTRSIVRATDRYAGPISCLKSCPDSISWHGIPFLSSSPVS
jgi:MoaA/NifB/PqqE/SkfB family radical SAM enzyme